MIHVRVQSISIEADRFHVLSNIAGPKVRLPFPCALTLHGFFTDQSSSGIMAEDSFVLLFHLMRWVTNATMTED